MRTVFIVLHASYLSKVVYNIRIFKEKDKVTNNNNKKHIFREYRHTQYLKNELFYVIMLLMFAIPLV